MNHEISIIIPFFNEGKNIKRLVNELNKYIHTLNIGSIEVIFVDDGSTDDSLEVLKRSEFVSYDTHIIKLSRNFGSHAALQAGILESNGNFITFAYADLQDPLDLIPKLYSKIKEGNNIVWAERRTVKVGIIEKIFSRLYAKLMQKLVIRNFPSKGYDVVMFDKKVKDELNQNVELNSSIFTQILFMGLKQDKIIYDKRPRKYGKSKWTLSKKIKMFIDSFVSFSYFPIRLVTITGFVLSFISIIWIIYIILGTIFWNIADRGWPTLICVILFGFGITNISIGIIAEYLWRTLDYSRKRKPFIIEKIYRNYNNK